MEGWEGVRGDTVLESAFVMHYDSFEKTLCMVFFLNIRFIVSFIAALRQFVVLLSKRTIVMYEGYVECMNCIFFSKVQLLILSAFKCSDDLFM